MTTSRVSVQQFERHHGEEPEPRCLHPDRRLPRSSFLTQTAPRSGTVQGQDRLKALALVVADTLPVQIDQMKEGLSLGQVGQRPFEMGYKTMMALEGHERRQGPRRPIRPTPAFDVCTPETGDTCIGSKSVNAMMGREANSRPVVSSRRTTTTRATCCRAEYLTIRAKGRLLAGA